MSTKNTFWDLDNLTSLWAARLFSTWRRYTVQAAIAIVMLCSPVQVARAGGSTAEEVRTIYPSEWGVPFPVGLAYGTGSNQLFLIDLGAEDASKGTNTTVVIITPYEDWVASLQLPFAVEDAINLTVDNSANRLLLLDKSQLASFVLDGDGIPSAASLAHTEIGHLHIVRAGGMAVDPTGRRLFILDSGASRVISADLENDLDLLDSVDLTFLNAGPLRGIAMHPVTHNLFVVSAAKQTLYELTQTGKLVRTFDLSGLTLVAPGGLAFGPSADLTDPSATLHLFIVDSNVPDQGAAVARPQDNTGRSDRHPVNLAASTHLHNRVLPMQEAAQPVYGKLVEIALTPDDNAQEECGRHFHSIRSRGGEQITRSPAQSTSDKLTVGR